MVFKENEIIWDRLKKINKPIVMYGMGNGADKILKQCKLYGIEIADIFASDEFVRGHIFAGKQVLRFSDIEDKYNDCIILLAFAAFRPDLMARIKHINEKFEVLAPDVPLFGDSIFTVERRNELLPKIEKLFNLLADDISKNVFINILEYKISGKIKYLLDCESSRAEVFSNIIQLCEKDVYLDLGAYDGDTVKEFVSQTNGKYEKIIAVEPDAKNYKKLVSYVEGEGLHNADCKNLAVWNFNGKVTFGKKGGRNSSIEENGIEIECKTIDSMLDNQRVSYIKMDVESAECQALEGAVNTLQNYHPALAISAYHFSEDFIEIPLLVHSICPQYKLYLRHHPYIPAWETNLYAVI